MNGTATRFLRLGVSLAALVTLGWVLTGHAAKPVRHSVPTDWSHRHLIFSHPATAERAARVSEDPRYWQQKYRREQRLAPPSVAEAEAGMQSAVSRPRLKIRSQKLHRDWSRNLGASGSVGAGNYPAKFSFDSNTAFCDAATTPDYVVFSSGLPGSAGRANVVAFDNIYFGCGGGTPLVYWAYNTGTGSTIKTSPVLSRDGTQVAFVQTTGTAATLVTLKWKAADGTPTSPSTPTLVASMSACIAAPCMTLTPLVDGLAVPTDDTTSSVFYDYTNDVAWVGGASGWLHKTTGLFNGTPTEVTTGGFPVQVNAGSTLSSPVYDRITNNVFVGDAAGFLYRVNATSATVVASSQLDFGVGIVEGPIVDSANHFVYVFVSSDGSGNCTTGADCAAVFQLSTSFATATSGPEVTVGFSTINGVALPNPLYIGGFDSAYFDSPDASGKLYVCGNTGSNPTIYQVQISAGALPVSGQGLAVVQLASATVPCSPVTDVPNENLPGGFSERLFVSVQNNGSSSTCGGGGCVLNFVSAPWINFTNYVVGQQVLSTKGHVETVIHAGTSAALATSEPLWTTAPASTVTDGNPGPTQVVWIDQGAFGAPFFAWISSHHYTSVKPKFLDENGNVEVLTTNPGGGLTSAIEPTWNTVPGGTTADNTVVWTNVGPLGTAALPAAGGTSGIIVDNTVGSGTVVGGSQIYFSTLSDQLCDFGVTGGCAVQASQPNLN